MVTTNYSLVISCTFWKLSSLLAQLCCQLQGHPLIPDHSLISWTTVYLKKKHKGPHEHNPSPYSTTASNFMVLTFPLFESLLKLRCSRRLESKQPIYAKPIAHLTILLQQGFTFPHLNLKARPASVPSSSSIWTFLVAVHTLPLDYFICIWGSIPHQNSVSNLFSVWMPFLVREVPVRCWFRSQPLPVYASHILMRPLFRPVASSSWSCPNLKRCHSILTQRLCFSGTEDPNARLHTMSPQSMICSQGLFFCPPSLFCLGSLVLTELATFFVPCSKLENKQTIQRTA